MCPFDGLLYSAAQDEVGVFPEQTANVFFILQSAKEAQMEHQCIISTFTMFYLLLLLLLLQKQFLVNTIVVQQRKYVQCPLYRMSGSNRVWGKWFLILSKAAKHFDYDVNYLLHSY